MGCLHHGVSADASLLPRTDRHSSALSMSCPHESAPTFPFRVGRISSVAAGRVVVGLCQRSVRGRGRSRRRVAGRAGTNWHASGRGSWSCRESAADRADWRPKPQVNGPDEGGSGVRRGHSADTFAGLRPGAKMKKPLLSRGFGGCGQGRGRTADLPIFSRTLVPTELPGRTSRSLRSATPTGLEPATSAVTGRRANQLRYGALMVPRPCYVPCPQRDSNPCCRLERAES